MLCASWFGVCPGCVPASGPTRECFAGGRLPLRSRCRDERRDPWRHYVVSSLTSSLRVLQTLIASGICSVWMPMWTSTLTRELRDFSIHLSLVRDMPSRLRRMYQTGSAQAHSHDTAGTADGTTLASG